MKNEYLNIIGLWIAMYIVLESINFIINYFSRKKHKKVLNLIFQLNLNDRKAVAALSDSQLKQYSKELQKACFHTRVCSNTVIESLALIDAEIILREKEPIK